MPDEWLCWQDCNGDKMVDCQDFAQLHYQGAGCEDAPDEDYKEYLTILNTCLAEVMKLAGSSGPV